MAIGSILVTVLHVIVCLFLIIVVLLQHGKSADIAATFGGQGSQAAFGPRGAATLLTKATTWAAILFMLTSITLSIFAQRTSPGGRSVLGSEPAQQQTQPPAPEPEPLTK